MPTAPTPQTGPADPAHTVRALLRREFPHTDVTAVRPLERGYTSGQWVADTGEGRLLVKVPRREPSAAHLRRLVAATRVAAGHGVPVVRHLRLLPHEPSLGGPVLLQEFQEGDAADEVWDTLGPDRRRALLQDLGTLVGRLHTAEGPHFGAVTEGATAPSLPESVEAEVAALLPQADPDLLDTAAFRTAIRAALARLDPAASVPVLVHGDLWLPNLLVRDGRISCVLDFEHAGYADRFRDFGKLDEHLFGAYPEGRDIFLTAYAAAHPLPDDWQHRAALGQALHALTMHVYFRRWTPRWAPQYARQAGEWLERNG